MSNNNIVVKLGNKPKKLIFKLSKKKGEPKEIKIPENEITKEAEKYYFKSKNLEPFQNYKTPYWVFSDLESITSQSSSYNPENYYHQYFSKEIGDLYRKYIPLTSYKKITENLKFFGWEFYKKYLNFSGPINYLNITNNFFIESIEEFYFYREKTNVNSNKDTVDSIECPDFLLEKNRKKKEEKISDSIKKFDSLKRYKINGNICQQQELFEELNLDKKYDFISIYSVLYYWPLKKYTSYLSAQFGFNCLIFALTKIKKNGILRFNVRDLNYQLIFDIIAVINYFFEEVEIFKSSNISSSQSTKIIVARKFKGMTQEEYQNLLDISKKWDQIQKDCFTQEKEFKNDKYYVSSILNFKNNIEQFHFFENLENQRKIEFWKKIIESYYLVREGGKKELVKLIHKKIYRTLDYYNRLDIDTKINTKKISRQILQDDFGLDYEANLFSFSKNRDTTNVKIKEGKLNFKLNKLEEAENRLKVSKRILDNMSDREFQELSKKLRKFITLRSYLEKRFTFVKTSQGFVKMFEILKIFNLLNPNKKIHKTFHLCEAPGQFIMATNHYLKTETSNEEFYWKAQSLIGNKALGDNYGLIKKYKDRWDFGPTKDGDITNIDNIKYYGEQMKDIDLITFDCGFDFSSKTMATYQDKFTGFLNYCQALIILQNLKIGSSFVIKVFLPQTLPYIISINYLLYKSFKELYIYKSFMNPESSEVYIVGRGFKGSDKKEIDKLIQMRENLKDDSTLTNIPKSFLEEYEEGILKFMEKNIDTILEFGYYSENKELINDDRMINSFRNENTRKWINYFGIRKIKKSNLL